MARGEGVVGAWVNLFAPDLVECCGYLGFDFVFLDGEHGLIGPAECLDLVRAADVASLVSFVRVPRNDPSTILGYLETGALGIVVPHVRTALEAQEAVADPHVNGGRVHGLPVRAGHGEVCGARAEPRFDHRQVRRLRRLLSRNENESNQSKHGGGKCSAQRVASRIGFMTDHEH